MKNRELDPFQPTSSKKDQSAASPSAKNKLSAIGDWLAPVFVWCVFLLMCSAVVAFVLGER